MDDLDVDILRELSRDRIVVWGSVDPRLSAQAVAKRLKVDPTTVRDRLRAWQAGGFHLGTTVLPNASLLGAGIASSAIRVADPRDKARVRAAFRSIPEVFGEMDHLGDWIGLGYFDEGEEALARLVERLSAIPGVAEATPPFGVPTPAAKIDPTPLDWRVIAALRAHPREPLSEAARAVGVSTKTIARRYERLVDGRALWSCPMYDFGACAGLVPVQVIVTFEEPKHAESALRELLRRFPPWISWHVVPLAGEGPARVMDAYWMLPSMGALDKLVHDARALPGALDVETYHPLRFEIFGEWADARIRERLPA